MLKQGKSGSNKGKLGVLLYSALILGAGLTSEQVFANTETNSNSADTNTIQTNPAAQPLATLENKESASTEELTANNPSESEENGTNPVIMKSEAQDQESEVAAHGPLPSEAQLNYHKEELAAFIHFGMNTFTDSEWGNGKENPSSFNPTELDAEQWIKTLKDTGFKRTIMVVKHHDGFALYPSEHTTHDVASSPWKNGQGDVLLEVSEAATKHDMNLGVYLSPWDANHPKYKVETEAEYNEYYLNQLKEILGNDKYGNNGKFVEVWMDGARGSGAEAVTYEFDKWFDYIRQAEGDITIFSSEPTSVRWIGNERGIAGDPVWHKVKRDQFRNANNAYLNSGDPEGDMYSVGEADVSIRPGWFYHANQQPKSLKDLMSIYFQSVGRGTPLLLNIPPDRRGKFADSDVARLQEFHATLEAMYATNLAQGARVTATSTRANRLYNASHLTDGKEDTVWVPARDAKTGEFVVDLGQAREFDVIELKEFIQKGQRIANFEVDVDVNGQWLPYVSGKTVGYRRLLQGQPVTASRLRVRITDAQATPMLSNFAVYKTPKSVELSDGFPFGTTYVSHLEANRHNSQWFEENEGIRGKSMWTNRQGAQVEFQFTGSKAYVVSTIDPNHGELEVHIDGQKVADVNTQSPTRKRSQLVYTTDDLTHGNHTLKLVNKTGRAIATEGIYILNNNGKGMFEVSTDSLEVPKGREAVVTIRRTGGSQGESTVKVITEPGTGVHGKVYRDTTEVVRFADGETEKTVRIPTLAYTEQADQNFDFTVKLTETTGGSLLGMKTATRVTVLGNQQIVRTPDVNHARGARVEANDVEVAQFSADKAVDGDLTTRWATNKDVATPTLTLNLPEATHIERVEVAWDQRANASRQITADPNVKAWKLSYTSPDQPDVWKVAHVRTGEPVVEESIAIAQPFVAKKLKLEVTDYVAGQLNWRNAAINEFRVFSNRLAGTTTPPAADVLNTPDVNHLQGARAEASDVEVAQFSADKAVDGDLTTRWATNKDAATPTLTLTLPQTTHIKRVELDWDPRANASRQITADPNVKAWRLSYATADAADQWQVAHERTTADPQVSEVINLATPVNAKYLKLEVLESVAGQLNWNNVGIREIRAYSNPAETIVNTPDVNHLRGAAAVASNVEAGTKFTGDKAVDGQDGTRWATDRNPNQPSLTLTLPNTTHIERVEIDWDPRANASRQITADPNVKAWRLSYATAAAPDQWQVAHERPSGDASLAEVVALSTPINAKYLKLEVLESVAGQLNWNNVGVREIRAYSNLAPAAGSRLDQIQSLNLNKDQTRLVLPDISGVELVGSDKDGVIDLAGRVYQPLTNQTVKVTLKQTLGSDVLTKEFELAVAGRYADEGVGQKPSVVPVVQQWHGREGTSSISNATVVVADDSNFSKAADLYREDLAARGLTLSRGNSTAAQRVEFKKVSDKGYGQEGYGITINNGVITIEADSHTGAFYATRTLLQMGETGLQNGEIRDFPSFSHRGFLLDTGRKFVPYDVVIDIMKNMAYYKMNDLQLHLNDNYIFLKKHIEGKNLTREQELEYVLNNATTGFRAEIDVVGENGVRLTSEEHYTKDQLRELVRLAGDLGINLVPEIDTPGHAMSFVKVRPDLMYKGAELGGHHNVERAAMLDLDAKYNETLAFVKSVYQKLYFDEDAPLKDVTTVHIGTDEYYGSSASYRRYLADMLQYVKEKGKIPRFWGSLSLKTQGQEIDGRGTELQIWNLGWHNPDLALAMGAKVINITDAPTYSVPSGNGSVGGYGDYSGYITQYDRWTPNDFRTAGRQGKNYPASHPQIIGGGHAVWNDNIDLHETGITSYDVFKRFFATMTVTADKTWGSPRLAPAFKDRQTLPEERLYAPNTNPEYRSAIDNITIGKDSLAALTSEGVTAGAEGLTFGKQEDYLATGLGQVGPNAVLNLEVTLDGTGPQGILTDGRNGIFLSDKDGKLAYAFEHLHVQFDKTLEPGRRYKVTFVTKELNTDVYVDDVKVARLPQAEHPALAYTSFVLPLDYVTGFKGTLHSLNLSTAPYVNPNIVNPQEFASIVASNQDNEHGGEISMAFDGNTGTIWHSDWVKKDPTYTVDMRLKEATALRSFTYLPRQSGTNGNILRYELYAKRDGALTKIAEGSWANDATEKEVLFDNLTTDHVQLKVLEGASGFASAAELTLHKVRVAQPQPENQGNGTGSNPGTDTGNNNSGTDSGHTGGTGTGSSTGSDTGNTGGTGTNTDNTGGDGTGTGTETGGTGTGTNTGTETRPTTLPNREVPESVPFETLKTNDPNLDLGQEVTDREGVPGRMIKVYEVTIKDGQEVLKLIDIKDIVLPEAKLVRVGTRPAAASFTNQVEETEDVPFEPVTVDDPNLDLGQRVTVRDGVPGRVTKIYDVTYDAAGKEVSRVFVAEKNRLDPVHPLILVGTRPVENRWTELREVSEVVAFETETITDENLDLGQEVIARKGVNGKRIKVYDVTFVNGENVGERLIEVKETLAPINQLVRVGTRPVAVSQTESREVIEAIDFDVEIIEDSNLELGMEVVVREGVKGSLVKVYEDTYVNGLKTGERLIDIKDMIAPVTKLVVVGKKVVSPEVIPQATTSDDAPSTETPQVVSPDDAPSTEIPQVVSPDDVPPTEAPQVVTPDDVPPTETPQVVTPDDAPSTETPQATTPVVVATPRDLVDPASRVHVLLDKDENPEIVGVRISHKETNDTATPAVLLGKDYDLFDIVTVDKLGQVLPISKSALVTLPVDEGKVVEKVFYLPEGGQPEERAFKMTSLTDENGGTRSAVAFIAEHFSDYGIIYQSASSSVLGEQGLPIEDPVMTPLKPVQISTPAQKVETRSEVVATSVPKNQVEGKAILPETGDSASSLVAIGAASLLATLGMAALRKHD